MTKLAPCFSCNSFVPEGLAACPNCGAQPKRVLIQKLTGIGAAAFTLVACNCYGGPIRPPPSCLPDGGLPPGVVYCCSATGCIGAPSDAGTTDGSADGSAETADAGASQDAGLEDDAGLDAGNDGGLDSGETWDGGPDAGAGDV